jgi:hypothetical protein
MVEQAALLLVPGKGEGEVHKSKHRDLCPIISFEGTPPETSSLP